MHSVLAAVALLVVVLAFAAWVVLDPGAPRRLVVSSSGERGLSDFWQIAIDEHNRYHYTNLVLERSGELRFAPYAERIKATPEVRWLAAQGASAGPGLTFWIEGQRRTVAPFIRGQGFGDHRALRELASSLHTAVRADLARQDAPRIAALTTMRDIREMRLDAAGGMCSRCVVLTVRANGTADLLMTEPPAFFRRRHGWVDWQRIVAVLRENHAATWERRYAVLGMDTPQANWRFILPHGEYDVMAPDVRAAPREIEQAALDVQVIAASGSWSPPLDSVALTYFAQLKGFAKRLGSTRAP
ncbi:MAG: hypothetical protein JOZ24_04545 [Candidatus Eremiobacteraeota bacterium]|nr:hypothetical protein [Candidatus Eremiobacteraeota bacterium]